MKVSTLLPNLNLPGIFGLSIITLVVFDVAAIFTLVVNADQVKVFGLPMSGWVAVLSITLIVVARKAWMTLRSTENR